MVALSAGVQLKTVWSGTRVLFSTMNLP